MRSVGAGSGCCPDATMMEQRCRPCNAGADRHAVPGRQEAQCRMGREASLMSLDTWQRVRTSPTSPSLRLFPSGPRDQPTRRGGLRRTDFLRHRTHRYTGLESERLRERDEVFEQRRLPLRLRSPVGSATLHRELADGAYRRFAATVPRNPPGRRRAHIPVLQAGRQRRLEHSPGRHGLRPGRVHQPEADPLSLGIGDRKREQTNARDIYSRHREEQPTLNAVVPWTIDGTKQFRKRRVVRVFDFRAHCPPLR